MKPKMRVIIDSGAYSAWKLNQSISLDDYCKYLEVNVDWIDSYINLDHIIPGDPEAAAAASFENLRIMRRRGLDPMAVFHVGEDISWLHRMLDAGCTHIGLAGLSLRQRSKVRDWYAYVWSHLVNHQGRPLVRVHALGEARAELLAEFPWSSSDSTSWVYSAQRNAKATLPDGSAISMRRDQVHTNASPDLEGLSGLELDQFNRAMKECGITAEAFADKGPIAAVMRTYLTAFYYLKLHDHLGKFTNRRWYPQGFLPLGRTSQGEGIPYAPFNLYLVSSTNYITWAVFAKLGFPNILASYYYIGGTSKMQMFAHLEELVRDPLEFVMREPVALKYYKMIEEFTHA